jgi:choline-sulfatase
MHQEVRPDWYHNMSSVLDAGPVVCTNQLDFDNEVIYKATQYLYDQVRYRTDQPFALTVSMTHPHDPYNMTKEFWDLYENVEIPLPKTPAIPNDQQDPHSQRLLKVIDLWGCDILEDKIIAARRAYFAACSYVDAQIAKLLRVLEDCGLAENTIIVFSGDHGDMLGERGLWYKMNWFEMSARVPLLVYAPSRYKPNRVKENVSTMDLLPTFVSMAGLSLEPELPIDGTSLMPFITGENGEKTDTAIGEYMGEGTLSTLVMIRRGQWKFIYSPPDPPQLYDVVADPEEVNNLAAGCPAVNAQSFAAANPKHASLAWLASAPLRPHLTAYFSDSTIPPTPPRTPGLYNPSNPSPPNGIYLAQGRTPPNGISNLSERTPPNGQLASASTLPHTALVGTTPQADVLRGFLTEAFARWDFEAIHKTVLESQRRRRLVHSALMEGKQTIWEYAPPVDPGAMYVRNRGKGNLDDTEWVSRWPRAGR